MKTSELSITFSKEITPLEIYGDMEIPEGYDIDGFRIHQLGETILSRLDGSPVFMTNRPWGDSLPLIILRKKREFHEKYRFASGVQPRPPRYGEKFITAISDVPEVVNANSDYGDRSLRFIVEEIKDNA
jgi:hypothetical protein